MVLAKLNALQKHGITITKEPIALRNGMGVGRPYAVEARKGTHQHEQGGLGQVKVGDERIHRLELIARGDEEVCLPLGCLPLGVSGGGRLQRAQAGGAHCNDSPARRLGLGDLLGGFLVHGAPLAVHAVLIEILRAHRRERATSHMQGDAGGLHAHLFEGREHGFVEVQARGGRGH